MNSTKQTAGSRQTLTPEQLQQARRAWQRLTAEDRNAIRKLVMYLDGSQVKDIRENALFTILTGGKP